MSKLLNLDFKLLKLSRDKNTVTSEEGRYESDYTEKENDNILLNQDLQNTRNDNFSLYFFGPIPNL